jgi:RNA polymerase primary sigma factor
MQAIAEQSRIVRLPLNRVGSLNKIAKSFSQLEQQFHRDPTTEELAQLTDMTEEEAGFTLTLSGHHLSLDAPFANGEENENRLLDVLENEHEEADADMMTTSLRKELERALATLNEREADVLAHYFGLDGEKAMTLEEIGKKYNLTRERVRQIKEMATRRLRYSEQSKLLKSYLG